MEKSILRPEEITADFLKELDNHLQDIVTGKIDHYFEIQDFAKILHIHPTHLSNTIKLTTGKAPCDFCHEKTLAIAKDLIENTDLKISEIAQKLTYEPTNFTKYFKKSVGQTPTAFRKSKLLNLS
jgi:AraC-like DNA-binding protein